MLPIIDNRAIELIKLPYLKETIKIKPYKGSQEKVILTSLASENDRKKWLTNIISVIQENLVDSTIDFEKLKIVDLIYICFKLRGMSKSDSINFSFKCNGETETGKCNHIFNESLKIDDILLIKNVDITEKLVEINPNLSVVIETPDIQYLNYLSNLDNSEYKQYESNESQLIHEGFDLIIAKLAYSIKSVIVINDNKPNVYNTFPKEELINNVLLNLTMEELTKIIDASNSLINLTIRFRKKCPICGKVYEQEDSNFFQYLT